MRTIEARVENGQIHLPAHVRLPNRAKVYILIPDADTNADTEVVEMPPLPPVVHLCSPRLVSPQDAARLEKTIVAE